MLIWNESETNILSILALYGICSNGENQFYIFFTESCLIVSGKGGFWYPFRQIFKIHHIFRIAMGVWEEKQ